MSLAQDCDRALELHAKWKRRFRELLRGDVDLDPTKVAAHDRCEFGCWLARLGRKRMTKDDHAAVHAAHVEFHRAAADVVRKHAAGDREGARADLEPDGAVVRATLELTRLLTRIRAKAIVDESAVA